MSRACLNAALCALFAAASLTAADFWTKDFLQWSDKEVAKMLTESPWAAQFTVSPRGMGGAPSGLAALSRLETFTVVWRSARPVKMAIARPAPGAALSADMQKYLDQPEPYYLVSISGTPRSFGVLPEDTKTLVSFAGLQVKGHGLIKPLEAVVRGEQNSVTILYGFPRTEPVVLDDGEVEFVFQMERTLPPPPPNAPAPAAGGRRGPPGGMRPPEPLDVQRKFDLRKMQINGKLEL